MTTSITKRLMRRLGLTVIGSAAGGAAGGGACGLGAGVRAGVNWIGCDGWAADVACGADSRPVDCGAAPFGGVKGSGCAAGRAGLDGSSGVGSRGAAGLGWVTLVLCSRNQFVLENGLDDLEAVMHGLDRRFVDAGQR